MQPLTFQRVEQKRTLRPKSTAITLTADLVTIFNFFFFFVVLFSSQNSLALFHNFGNYSIFLVKSKLSTAKKSKTTTFSRVFHPKNRQFSREFKVEFLDKKWRFRTVCLEKLFSIEVISTFFLQWKFFFRNYGKVDEETPWKWLTSDIEEYFFITVNVPLHGRRSKRTASIGRSVVRRAKN